MKRIIAGLLVSIALLFPAAVANAGSGGAGNDRLYGTVDADYLSGGPGQDVIFGKAGDDVIHSGPGADSIWGGRGFDVCYVSAQDIASGCEVVL